jgi:hypothetical protein
VTSEVRAAVGVVWRRDDADLERDVLRALEVP